MTRKPCVSGQFYEADMNQLNEQIKESFLSKRGPGTLPANKREKDILGVICPHAGYAFSGACAAWSYSSIAEAGFPDVFIIIGPSHYGTENPAATLQDFETPFGVVKTDAEFVNALAKKGNIIIDEDAHASEHSIEVQLPFLQFANKDRMKDIKIAPITVSGKTDCKALGCED